MTKKRRQSNKPSGFLSSFKPRFRAAALWVWDYATGEAESWVDRTLKQLVCFVVGFLAGVVVHAAYGPTRVHAIYTSAPAAIQPDKPP